MHDHLRYKEMDMQLHRDWVREVWLGLVGACGASIDLSSVPQDGTLGASGIGRRGGRRSSVSTPVPQAPAGTEQRRPIDPRAVLCSAPSRYDDSRGGLARHILLPAFQLPPWSSHRLHTHTILPLRLDLKGPLSAQCCSTCTVDTCASATPQYTRQDIPLPILLEAPSTLALWPVPSHAVSSAQQTKGSAISAGRRSSSKASSPTPPRSTSPSSSAARRSPPSLRSSRGTRGSASYTSRECSRVTRRRGSWWGRMGRRSTTRGRVGAGHDSWRSTRRRCLQW